MSPAGESGGQSVAGSAAVSACGPLDMRTRIANVAPLIVMIGLFNASVFADMTMASRLYALVFMLVVPGLAIVSLTPMRPERLSVRIGWSLGVSMLLLMVMGVVYSFSLPHLGVSRPISQWPVVIGVDSVTLAALVAHRGRRDPLDYLFRGAVPTKLQVAVAMALFLVPLAASAGAELLNNGRGTVLAVAVQVGVGILLAALFFSSGRTPDWAVGMTLFAATAALLLMFAMRSNYPFGYDIQSEYQVFTATLHRGAWEISKTGNAYSAMLSITVLPATLVVGSHMSPEYVFKAIYPIVFSLFPVLTFAVAGRWFPRRAALVGAIVVVVQGLYAADITGLARQEIGLFYFVLLVATAFDADISRRVAQVGVVVSAAGMAVSHYSTAYFAIAVIIGGYVTFGVIRLVRRRSRPTPMPVFSLPVIALTLGSIFGWNVGVTHSAQNVLNLVTSIESNGLQILSGARGSSLIQRFLNADVATGSSPSAFASRAVSYVATHDPWIHPYRASITDKYPPEAIAVTSEKRRIPALASRLTSTLTTVIDELLLLVMGIGGIVLLWRERRAEHPALAEIASIGLATLAMLALLRLSGTVSTLYNAPRGQVQGAPIISVGLAVVFGWLFARRHHIGGVFVGGVVLAMSLLLFSDSGLAAYALDGSGAVQLVNFGEDYQRYNFTRADLASAQWLVTHARPGEVVYADVYGGLQIFEYAHLRGLVTAVLPQIIEPGAYVYATSTNLEYHTDRSVVGNDGTLLRFPLAFLNSVKNVVYSTGTTEVFR